MENLTQQQIEKLIQFIDEAEEPATITNTIVAAVLAFLAVKIAGTATAQALLDEIVARQTADTNLSTAINQLQQLIQSMGSVVYFDSMGELDGDVDIHVDTGMVVYDPENDIIKKYTSPSQYEPVSCDAKLLYCNKVTGYFYRYSTRSGMVQVGGGGGISEDDIINDLTTGGRNKALSAEMGKELARMISNAGSSRVLEQRVAIIAEILQNAVFTSDQSQRFEDLAALEDAVDSITLNVSSHTFNGIGGTFTLIATTVPSGKSVRWESSNPAVATVDSNGVVTPVSYGPCVITAKAGSNNVAATCSITVQQFQVDSVSIDQSDILLDSVAVGYTKQLTATTMYNGQAVQAGVTWSSSNPGVATIDANTGLVTVIGNGQTTITATSGTESDTITIRVSGVVHEFHVRLGTLSNVTIEDGQGTAIEDDQTVLENSSLTVKLVPFASHQITTASVTMDGVAQTLTDNQDGSKSVALTVDGDIAVSASAEFHAVNLANQSTLKTGYGVRSTGKLEENASLSAYVIPIEYGKRYIILGWDGIDATMSANRIAILKGNTNNSACLASTDFASSSVFYTQNELFTSGNCLRNFPARDFMSFKAPLASDMVDAAQLYICINCAWTGSSPYDVTQDIEVYECPLEVGSYVAVNRIWQVQIKGDKTFVMENSAESALVKLDKGETYDFSGYTRSTGGGQQNYANFAILKTGNGGMTWEKLTSADVSGYTSDFFAVDANGVIASDVQQQGSFTVPSTSQLNTQDDLYLLVKMKYGSLLLIDDTNLVIEKR